MDGTKRPKKARKNYDPQSIVSQWLSAVPSEKTSRWRAQGHTEEALAASLPKRFMVYEPMVLFSPGAFAEPMWRVVLEECAIEEKEQLFKAILGALSKVQKGEVTHLAINAGIPLYVSQEGGDSLGENVLRSPVEIITLHGNFGPDTSQSPPTAQDLEEAFWVSTKQNGIFQTWAPRHTMFSRGNITEKARVLDFHGETQPAGLERRKKPSSELKGRWAVDLYAGIGYFVFSYAKRGMNVLCWEINPWSVEGLRRGALQNGWRVRVIQGQELERPVAEVVGNEQIIVFVEDNKKAWERIQCLRGHLGGLDVLHVNGGLLPTGKDTWQESWMMAASSTESWLHLHENVAEEDIDKRRGEILEMFRTWAGEDRNQRRPEVEHVERVKTIAPRVWHCVFDVYITKLLPHVSKESQIEHE
ncbi:hypothetical protein jhhlp_003832 [Lomentospora prolificans]|uniref:tRNA wybutosine-synthesizing protein 2 n=1 Tax=Lomentospora prolificans TaxID=41688 RepID=A0A2N3N9V0_9PEZI|nr:hypothetical protein jhhlp_003832 [Lomentospora prolificans]